jgi:hypothetical protein
MVKFSRNYAKRIEFAVSDYFDYDRLKKLIHHLNGESEGEGRASRSRSETIPTSYGEICQVFVHEFLKEVSHVEGFYTHQLHTISQQLDLVSISVCSELEGRFSDVTLDAAPPPILELTMRTLSMASPKSLRGKWDGLLGGSYSPVSLSKKVRPSLSVKDGSVKVSKEESEEEEAGTGSDDNVGAGDGAAWKPINAEEKKAVKARLASLKRSLSVIFHDLEKMDGFRLLNYTAFLKVLKKFDKVHSFRRKLQPTDSENEWENSMHDEAMKRLDGVSIGSQASITALTNRAEQVYADAFCKGDVQEAYGKLRLGKGEEPEDKKVAVSFKSGICATLLVWFLFDVALHSWYVKSFWADPALLVFTFFGNIVVYRWLWAASVHTWESAHVNYVLLLRFSNKNTPHQESVFEDAINLSIWFLLCIIGYLDSLRDSSGRLFGAIPAYTFIFIMIFVLLIRFSHSYFCAEEFHGIFSPTILRKLFVESFVPNLDGHSRIVDRLAGDYLVSLSRELSLFVNSSCYIFSGAFLYAGSASAQAKEQTLRLYGGPNGQCDAVKMDVASAVLVLVPLIIRCLQCLKLQFDSGDKAVFQWPQGWNTVKYVLNIVVTLLGTFHKVTSTTSVEYRVFFALICVAATAYNAWFDVVVDFGLWKITLTLSEYWDWIVTGSVTAPTNIFLRNRLMYTNRSFYYFVLVVNPILRALWTISLLPSDTSIGDDVSKIGPFLCAIELFRRWLWSCIKLENDHVHRSELWYSAHQGGRAAGTGADAAVSIVPLHFGESIKTHALNGKHIRTHNEKVDAFKRISILVVFCGSFVGLAFFIGVLLEPNYKGLE